MDNLPQPGDPEWNRLIDEGLRSSLDRTNSFNALLWVGGMLVVVVVAVVIIIAGLTVLSSAQGTVFTQPSTWPTATGRIEEAYTVDRGDGRFDVRIGFSYVVGERTFTGEQVVDTVGSQSAADERAAGYRGDVQVVYHPAVPGFGLVDPPGDGTFLLAVIIMGGLTVMVVVGFFIVGLFILRRLQFGSNKRQVLGTPLR
ncbi:MAG: hypothetical protein ACFB51_15620 [Anaerolineae bacterium]